MDLLLLPLPPTSHKSLRSTSSNTPHFFAASHCIDPWRHGPSRVTSSMPRRKASERDQPHRRRSRNGCLNCRRRKIRCDEKAPSCSYCIARGLTCSRGGVVLKWEAEYADNGLAFGRQGVGPTAHLQACLRHTNYLYRYGANTANRNQTTFAWTKLKQSGCLYRPWRSATLSTTVLDL
jgi:hypothetical protein